MVLEFVYILLISLLVGTLLGIEREIKFKPIGLRTNILIVVASSMAIYLSQMMTGDHLRVAAALLTGLGFIGAGAILHPSKKKSQGLTTAALVLVDGVEGIFIGTGHFLEAISLACFVLFVLVAGGFVESKLFHRKEIKRKI